ncbi:MAG: peptide deformylase [Verrucomicrobia bacterium]|nr:peptide deformylase [Verrucomicrobiota bacterium]
MMKELELRTFPDPILRVQADPILRVGEHERHLLKSMFENMWRWDGVGLAAPQVGFDSRLIVAEAEGAKLGLANPEILESEGSGAMVEGCLSLPGQEVDISRPTSIWVQALDIENREVELKLDGFLARIVQHEIDHLNGILIIDYGSAMQHQAGRWNEL